MYLNMYSNYFSRYISAWLNMYLNKYFFKVYLTKPVVTVIGLQKVTTFIVYAGLYHS